MLHTILTIIGWILVIAWIIFTEIRFNAIFEYILKMNEVIESTITDYEVENNPFKAD